MTGAELKALRALAGWNQEDAAKRLGVSQTAISRWEHRAQPVNVAFAYYAVILAEQETGKDFGAFITKDNQQ